MNEQVIQKSVEMFVTKPEEFQKAFQSMGVDFNDELVAKIKQSPDFAVQLLSSDENLLSAVVQIANSMQIFKHGGKLE